MFYLSKNYLKQHKNNFDPFKSSFLQFKPILLQCIFSLRAIPLFLHKHFSCKQFLYYTTWSAGQYCYLHYGR